jgi:MinD superfamily P-loop ATPase
MKLAIASGKGGTGKTTVSTNLAATIARQHRTVTYVDCDVEAPNGHLFLKPVWEGERPVGRLVPQVDGCLHCGACAEVCRFHAIVCLPERTIIYPELCHSCGGCALACPAGAITEILHPLGVLRFGTVGRMGFLSGTLAIGEATSPPVIHAAKEAAPPAEWTIWDAPPGTSCPMIETIKDCDFVLLVTEPTPFGLHDLRLAVDVAKALRRPCGVVVNRAQAGATETHTWCREAGVPILAEIPDSVDMAKAYARGELVVESVPGMRVLFEDLFLRLQVAEGESASGVRRQKGDLVP